MTFHKDHRHTRRKILLLWLTVFVCGCASQNALYHVSPVPEDMPAPIASPLADDDLLSAVAQIDVVMNHRHYPAQAALLIKKPSYLRLELIPVLGTPDFFLTANPEKLSIFIPSKKEFYIGKPTQANLVKFLPWPLSVEDLVWILSGTYPPLRGKNIAYERYQENKLLRVEMKEPSGPSQIAWFDEKYRLRKFVRRNDLGEETYNIAYDHYETPEPVPGKISIHMADGITSLTVRYSDLKVEKSTGDLSIFDLSIPPDVRAISLDLDGLQ